METGNPLPGSEVKEGAEEQREEFSFLQETIKPKKESGGRMLMRSAGFAVTGLIFGLFACCGFFALKPWAESTFQGEAEEVTIPEDEEEEPEEEEEEPEPVVPVLTADSYKEIMRSMYNIVREADQSIVSVRPVAESDWADAASREQAGVTGLIAADNGREILILADDSVSDKASEWTVVFADGNEYPATLQVRDKNRGLAVFGIAKNSIESGTLNTLSAAVLGNSNIVSRGDVVFALGNMYGYDHGMSYGVVGSKEYEELFSDARCSVIATDIALSPGGTGVLVNQRGEVVGLIRSDVWVSDSGIANALAISDLKSVLELMLNGGSVPYIGIHGVTVTEEISLEQGIPQGLYVTSVETDSPAMEAGIQNGDVLLEVNGQAVTGTTSYEQAVLQCTVGESAEVVGMRRGAGDYVDIQFDVTVGSRE